MAHPPNAAYISDDGRVSYDAWGRRLDSLGNVARGGYGGGGSGGDSTAGGTTAPGTAFAALPASYLAGLKSFLGAEPTDYYGTRGAEKGAQTDYYNLLNTWQNKTGVPLTDDDWARVWAGLTAYKSGQQQPGQERTFTVSDAFNYLGRMLTAAPRQPLVSYLRTGEI